MIIVEVFGQEPPQMSRVQDDHVIQAFAANTPDQPLDVRILPRTPWGNPHFFDAYVRDALLNMLTVDGVPVP